MKKINIGKNEANQRIDKFLRKYMPKAPLSFVYKMLRKRNIKVNQKRIDNTYILHEGDILEMYMSEETISEFQEQKKILSVDRSFSIVYEDENILFVGKPMGLLIHEDKHEGHNTLINQAIKYLYDKGEYNPTDEKTFVPASVNRLDRNTSGLVIIGKNYKTIQNLNEMLRNSNRVHKYYLAVVAGKVVSERVLRGYLIKDEAKNQVKITDIEEPGSKPIHSIIRPQKVSNKFSLVEVEIITGRSHQIRLHMASIGHPIIGDPKYGDTNINRNLKEDFGLTHQFLHAYRLYFEDCTGHLEYLSGKSFLCPLPENLERIENTLF